MAATVEFKIYTGTDAGTENPLSGDGTNWNLMSVDQYDSTGTGYQTNRLAVPSTGTNYSFERWFRFKFTGIFNLIENCKFWHSAGTLSDVALDLLAGENGTTGVTPVNTISTIATTTLTGWDSEGEAVDIQNGTMDTADVYTKYGVIQLKIPDTVVTPGDIGTQTMTFQYDES